MTLAQDFEDFVKLLNKHQVDYMVVGGYALAFHGKPRHTGDLDIWINNSETNAEKLVNAIKEFGLASLGLTKSDFMQEGYVTQNTCSMLQRCTYSRSRFVISKEYAYHPNRLILF
jgi:hypothetical protein